MAWLKSLRNAYFYYLFQIKKKKLFLSDRFFTNYFFHIHLPKLTRSWTNKNSIYRALTGHMIQDLKFWSRIANHAKKILQSRITQQPWQKPTKVSTIGGHCNRFLMTNQNRHDDDKSYIYLFQLLHYKLFNNLK